MTRTSVPNSTKGLIIENPNATRAFESENLDKTIQSLEAVLQHHRQLPAGRKTETLYHELVCKYMKQYRNAKQNGTPVVYGAPSTIVDAMGLLPYAAWATTAALALSQGLHQEIQTGIQETGLLPFVCTAGPKYPLGGVVRGYMLPPDLIVSQSRLCTGFSTGFEFWAHYTGVPCFRLDRPYTYSENGVKYFTKQLENLISWLEEQTGHKMDWDRLQENVECMRQIREVRQEIADLRKAIPHPMRSRHSSHIEVIGMYWEGRPEAVQFYSQIRNEIKERVAQNKGYLENERLRLLCMYLPPAFAVRTFDWWERAWGAVSVMEPLFEGACGGAVTTLRFEMDPKRPVESLARNAFITNRGTCGSVTVEDTVRMAREHSADGAVWYSPATCNESIGLIQMVRDALKKQVGIPLLVVDVDYFDPSFVSEEELRARTEPFFEMLCDLKGV